MNGQRPGRALLHTFLFFFIVSTAANAETLREQFDKSFRLGPNGSFVLRNVNGGVTIRSWDRPEVRIEAEKRVESGSSERARQVMNALEIVVRESPGRLEVVTKTPANSDRLFAWLSGSNVNSSVRYRVMVPKSTSLEVETVNGHVDVADVAGSMRVDTTNGRIDLLGASGPVEASTTNGAIRVNLTRLGNEALDFSTTNGAITLELPPTLKASIDAGTTNGSIRTDFPVEVTGSLSRTRLKGTINGGGLPLRLRTTNGSIRIIRTAG